MVAHIGFRLWCESCITLISNLWTIAITSSSVACVELNLGDVAETMGAFCDKVLLLAECLEETESDHGRYIDLLFFNCGYKL